MSPYSLSTHRNILPSANVSTAYHEYISKVQDFLGFFFFFRMKTFHSLCSTQILFHVFLLLGGHHTNIFHLPFSIFPSIQTRMKCKLDIWCCDVSDNTGATPEPPHKTKQTHKHAWTHCVVNAKKGTVKMERHLRKREGKIDKGMHEGRTEKILTKH